MKPKHRQINIRVEEDLYEKLLKIEASTDVDPISLVRHALKAISGYYEEHGEIRVPFSITPLANQLPKSGSSDRKGNRKKPE